MARPTQSERLQQIHAEALAEFDRIQSAVQLDRQQCLEDRRFYSIAGAQWENALGEQFANKPKFEVNKVHLAVLRIINEYRNNRISVDFVSKDGTKDDELADTCDGLFRADEHDSGAEEAYDNAFEEAVGGGFGAIRLRADYEDDENPEDERQRIRFEPIFDADASVFFDLDAKRQDKADARLCFVVYSMTPEAYKDEWGDDPANWPQAVTASQYDWAGPDKVSVAELYRVEDEGDWAITYEGAAGDEKRILKSALTPEVEDELAATGYRETRRRRIRARKVCKYILSGGSVLEDCGKIAGKCIPIVPVYGKRWYIDGVERCMGHVRLAKDPQRLKNMQLSKLAEQASLSSVSKPILLPDQIAGLGNMWAEDNLKNYPYLLINPITGADGSVTPSGPIAYTKPPEIAPAQAALLQLTEGDMQDILGNAQQAEKIVSNISGKAIEMVKANLDMQTYIYMSNFAKAVRRVGEVWLSMARDVYVEEGRKMKTLGSADQIGTVELQTAAKDPNSGALTKAADLTRASFDVAVEVGPSSNSRREATVRSLTNMLQVTQDPETAQVLQAMAIMNMEGEGIADVREYFRKKLVGMGALKPTDEEAQAMAASSQPSAQDLALQGMAEESQAKATKARADVLETMANVELIHAETVEKLAGVDMDTAERAAELAARITAGAPQAPAAAPRPGA